MLGSVVLSECNGRQAEVRFNWVPAAQDLELSVDDTGSCSTLGSDCLVHIGREAHTVPHATEQVSSAPAIGPSYAMGSLSSLVTLTAAPATIALCPT